MIRLCQRDKNLGGHRAKSGTDRAKNGCASHGIARRNWEIQEFFGIFLRLNYYFAANFRQVFKDETVVFNRYFVPLIQDGL